jgi:hypothetical protein
MATIKAIGKMDRSLIKLGWYNATQDNQALIRINREKYFFSFWLWGRLSAVKPEYKKLLEPYFE